MYGKETVFSFPASIRGWKGKRPRINHRKAADRRRLYKRARKNAGTIDPKAKDP